MEIKIISCGSLLFAIVDNAKEILPKIPLTLSMFESSVHDLTSLDDALHLL